jgi:integrase/recombinase XerC
LPWCADAGHRLAGPGPITEIAHAYLKHLHARHYSPMTLCAYAFDLLNFSRLLADQEIALRDVVPTDCFGYLE